MADGELRHPVCGVANGFRPGSSSRVTGEWHLLGMGVLGPEPLDAVTFLELMAKEESLGGYGQSWHVQARKA